MKDDTVGLIKFRTLKRLLDLSEWQVVGLLESLWLFARKNAPMGDVGRFSNLDIAASFEWGMSPDDLITALVDSKWLDRTTTDSRLVCHDWYDHAPSYIVRRINLSVLHTDTKTPTPAGRVAWRMKMFGRENDDKPPTLGAKPIETRPAGATNGPKDAQKPSRAREPNPTQPNPTTPEAPSVGALSKTGEPQSVSWSSLSSDFDAAGMDLADELCRVTKAAGNLPHEVAREFAKGRKLGLDIGTIYNKLSKMVPDRRVNWPQPTEDVQRQEAREESRRRTDDTMAQLQRDRAEAAKKKLTDAAELERLEASHGAELDAMKPAAVKRLADEHYPALSHLVPKRGRIESPLLRRNLLRALSGQTQEAAT